jgi:hypothetical protein
LIKALQNNGIRRFSVISGLEEMKAVRQMESIINDSCRPLLKCLVLIIFRKGYNIGG